jgi:DNA-binding NarL/FixJ family response regulator
MGWPQAAAHGSEGEADPKSAADSVLQLHVLRKVFQIAPVPGLIFDSFRLVGTNSAARSLINQRLLTPQLLMKARSAAYTDSQANRILSDGPAARFRLLVAAPEARPGTADRFRVCFLLPAGAPEQDDSALDRFGLSPPQRRVAVLLQTGKKNREIAECLGLSTETVRKHVAYILATTESPTRAAFVALTLSRMG